MGTFAGYVRVSRVGDRADTLISPQLQEREIRNWAKPRELELEMLPAELDRSGADDNRPILQGAIERIEQGELEGVIVWNFARFTRSLASSVAFLESIERAGGQLYSTSEQIDPTTPAGRMTRNFLFSIAQAEREQKAEGFDKAKADAVKRGIWTAPVVPFGYRKNAERRLEPDPVEGPVRAEVIRRRGAGHSWRSLAKYIREETGRSFLPAAVRQMVRSRTSLGEASQGRHVNPNAHEPLVDRATWEAAQVAQPKPARGIHGEALLGGLVRCAGCSRRVSSTFRNGRRYYSCRRYHAAGDCPEPASISAPLIEPYVTEALFAHARELAYTSSERTSAIENAQEKLEEAEAELALYQETVRLSEVGAAHFEAGMRSRVADVEEARRALAAQRLASPRVLPGTLSDLWPKLSVVERRQVLRGAFSVIWIRRGRGAVAERVRLIADGFEPADLSVQGRPAGPPVTITWPDGDLKGEVRIAGG
jgi:DNA invertase Pin-like site-specific DNA recombinase